MKFVPITTALVAALGLSIGLYASTAVGASMGRSSTMTASPTTSNAATHTTAKTTGTTSTANGPNAATAVRGPAATGQPNQSCQAAGSTTPGNAASAPGSAFNPDGNAGTHYAGQQPQNSRNTASVAQYDVACTRPTH
jgi:hypothetical protein